MNYRRFRTLARHLFLASLAFTLATTTQQNAAAQQKDEGPQPRVVDPGSPVKAPSDAVVLFDGTDVSHFVRAKDGEPCRCTVEKGVMACVTGVGDIVSTEKFKDAQIHLEFMPPYMPEQHSQLRGNSGVYLQGRYEIQILDSYQNPTYAEGVLAALYGQAAPLVNAARRPREWSSYDMIYHAPRCDAKGNVTDLATVTVILNGVLVQDHMTIAKSGQTKGCPDGPLLLQDHSGFPGAPVTTMSFRNIWFRHFGRGTSGLEIAGPIRLHVDPFDLVPRDVPAGVVSELREQRIYAGACLRVGRYELDALVLVSDGKVAFDLDRAERLAVGLDAVAHDEVVADVGGEQRRDQHESNASEGSFHSRPPGSPCLSLTGLSGNAFIWNVERPAEEVTYQHR